MGRVSFVLGCGEPLLCFMMPNVEGVRCRQAVAQFAGYSVPYGICLRTEEGSLQLIRAHWEVVPIVPLQQRAEALYGMVRTSVGRRHRWRPCNPRRAPRAVLRGTPDLRMRWLRELLGGRRCSKNWDLRRGLPIALQWCCHRGSRPYHRLGYGPGRARPR